MTGAENPPPSNFRGLVIGCISLLRSLLAPYLSNQRAIHEELREIRQSRSLRFSEFHFNRCTAFKHIRSGSAENRNLKNVRGPSTDRPFSLDFTRSPDSDYNRNEKSLRIARTC